MKKFRISQLPIIVQVFLAMFLGMSQGWFMPAWFIRIFVTFNDFFGQFIPCTADYLGVGNSLYRQLATWCRQNAARHYGSCAAEYFSGWSRLYGR